MILQRNAETLDHLSPILPTHLDQIGQIWSMATLYRNVLLFNDQQQIPKKAEQTHVTPQQTFSDTIIHKGMSKTRQRTRKYQRGQTQTDTQPSVTAALTSVRRGGIKTTERPSPRRAKGQVLLSLSINSPSHALAGRPAAPPGRKEQGVWAIDRVLVAQQTRPCVSSED